MPGLANFMTYGVRPSLKSEGIINMAKPFAKKKLNEMAKLPKQAFLQNREKIDKSLTQPWLHKVKLLGQKAVHKEAIIQIPEIQNAMVFDVYQQKLQSDLAMKLKNEFNRLYHINFTDKGIKKDSILYDMFSFSTDQMMKAIADVDIVPTSTSKPLHAEWMTIDTDPTDSDIEDINTDKVILFIHGGAWCLGSPSWSSYKELFLNMLTSFSEEASASSPKSIGILGIDYRLSPEHPFPASIEDSLQAYLHLLNSGIAAKDIIIMGDSAGGNIALALSLLLPQISLPPANGLVLLSPLVDASLSNTYINHSELSDRDPLLSREAIGVAVNSYIGSVKRFNDELPLFKYVSQNTVQRVLCDDDDASVQDVDVISGVPANADIYDFPMSYVENIVDTLHYNSHNKWFSTSQSHFNTTSHFSSDSNQSASGKRVVAKTPNTALPLDISPELSAIMSSTEPLFPQLSSLDKSLMQLALYNTLVTYEGVSPAHADVSAYNGLPPTLVITGNAEMLVGDFAMLASNMLENSIVPQSTPSPNSPASLQDQAVRVGLRTPNYQGVYDPLASVEPITVHAKHKYQEKCVKYIKNATQTTILPDYVENRSILNDFDLCVYPGMFHVFPLSPALPETKHALNVLSQFVSKNLDL